MALIKRKKIIGIVGGVGPYAGLDLVKKIFDETISKTDQDHLPVALLSIPEEIGDRTDFLEGKTDINPALAISDIIRNLEKINASVVAIACNAIHSPPIFDVIVEELEKTDSKAKLLNMIEETAEFIKNKYPEIKKVSVLSVKGAYRAKVYSRVLEKYGFLELLPPEELQAEIHNAVCSAAYGIKAFSNPVTEKAKNKLTGAIDYLQKKGAELIILGCTEIAFVIKKKNLHNTILIDPTRILARALIRETSPHKLKPY